MPRNLTVEAEVTTQSALVAVTSAYGGAGQSVAVTTQSLSARVANAGEWPIEFRVGGVGPWQILLPKMDTRMVVDLSSTQINLRKGYLALDGKAQIFVEALTGKFFDAETGQVFKFLVQNADGSVSAGGAAVSLGGAKGVSVAPGLISNLNYLMQGGQRSVFSELIYQAARANVTALSRQWEAVEWAASEAVALGAVRVTTAFKVGTSLIAMKIHRCTTAGITGTAEPTWATTAASTTTDGTATWTAYPCYFFDADNGNDSTGDGSQATPWKTMAKATVFGGAAILRTGNGIFFRRGTTAVYSGTQPSLSGQACLAVVKDGSDTTYPPPRRTVGAWGTGRRPVFDGTGKSYGIQFGASTAGSASEAHTTISDLEIKNLSIDNATAGAGAYGIYAPADTSAAITDVKVFRTYIHDVINPTGTLSTDDFDGVKIVGTGALIVDCDIDNIDDDGIWLDGTNDTRVLFSRVRRVARSFLARGRLAGDCIQLAGTGTQNNVELGWNVLDHSDAACKQGILMNPASASTGLSIHHNILYGADTTVNTNGHIALYLARVSGAVHDNILYLSAAPGPLTAPQMQMAGNLLGYNNLIVLKNGASGVYLGNSGDSGNPSATNSEWFCNTLWSIDGLGRGLSHDNAATNVSIEDNLFVNLPQGIVANSAATVGPNAFLNVAVPISGSAARVAGYSDVISQLSDYGAFQDLMRWSGMPPVRSDAQLATDITGRARASYRPTPGAFEVA